MDTITKNKLNLAVLLSGIGTTLQNLIDRISEGSLQAKIVLVLSSKEDAYGLIRAKNAGIDAYCVSPKKHDTNEDYNNTIYDYLDRYPIDLIILAGFMNKLRIDKRFINRVINVHPALIPSFCGKGFYGERVHKAVLEYGVKITGCTVHFVNDEYDQGPIILQKAVEINDNDSPEILAKRVQNHERIALVEAIKLFSENRLKIDGRIVKIKDDS